MNNNKIFKYLKKIIKPFKFIQYNTPLLSFKSESYEEFFSGNSSGIKSHNLKIIPLFGFQ